MKFMVIYRERRADLDPAAAQRRAARLLNERDMPPGVTVRELVGRVGANGGYAIVEADDAKHLQLFAAIFSAYDCRIEPVVDLPFHAGRRASAEPARAHARLPDMPPNEPHEGAFSDDDIYDTED